MDWGSLLMGGQGQTPQDYQQQSQFQDRNQIQSLINGGLGRSNYNAQPLDQSQANQFRQMQMAQAQQLSGIASGQQKGAGELAAQRQMQQNIAQQQALAAMARGGNSALAARNAAMNSANIGLQGAGQAQQAALQDQQNAQSALGQTLNAGRSTDVNVAQANAANALQANQQNSQMYQAMLGQLTGMDQAQLQAQMQAYGAGQQNKGILGGLINQAGAAGAKAALG